MRSLKAAVGVLLVTIFPSVFSAQTPNPPNTVRTISPRDDVEMTRRMANLHTIEQRLANVTRRQGQERIELNLTDAQRDRILMSRRVPDSYIRRYGNLLRQEQAGLFKIFPDLGCISKAVVKLTAECEPFIPLSSAFKFRTNEYGDDLYHDIRFKDGRISSGAFFSQGIFGVIGNEPIASIGLTHAAVKYLAEFQPAADFKSATEHAKQFQSEIDAGGFRYSDHIAPQENVTYVMRMIAYRLENILRPLSDETTTDEVLFHSLINDKRVDAIFAFRVLEKDELGGLTIVWKELSRNDAPKIKFGKSQTLKDFRPDQK